jgi:hypothetical protein
MKIVGVAALLIAAGGATTHADVELRGSGALRLGVQHTSVDKDDGAPDAWGPRLEASGELAVGRYVSFAAVTAASWYSDDGLYDGVTSTSYDLEVRDLSIGARFLVWPHPRVFIGLGLHEVFTRERATLEGGNTLTFHNTAPELIAGGTVASYREFRLQVVATAGVYQRFDGLEQVQFSTLSFGVSR